MGIIKELEPTIIKEKIQALGTKSFISTSQFMPILAFFPSEITNSKEENIFLFCFYTSNGTAGINNHALPLEHQPVGDA